MGLASTVANLGGALDNTLSAFGIGQPNYPYPSDIAERVSNKIEESDKSWRKSLGYGFQVVRVSKTGAVSEAEDWKEFILQINPQELSQDEIFAIQVTPTYSGVLVEHQGTTLKDINISGTTGLSPNRREGGSFPQSGAPVFAAGHSGYKEFHDLRTYIRTYVEQKRDDPGKAKGELRLIWRNLRDKEDLYVEPQKFSMKRSAKKPHLYDYTIALKAIGVAKGIDKDKGWLAAIDDFIEDAQDAMDSALKILQGALGFVATVQQDIKSTVMGPVLTYSLALQSIKGGKNQIKSFNGLVKDITKSVNSNLNVGKTAGNKKTQEDLKKAKNEEIKKAVSIFTSKTGTAATSAAATQSSAISAALQASLATKATAEALTKENVKKTLENIITAYDNIADYLGIDSGLYGEVKGFISTLSSEAEKAGYDELKVLKALGDLKGSMYKLLQDNKIYLPSSVASAAQINKTYENFKEAKQKSAALKEKAAAEAALAAATIAGDVVKKKQAENDLLKIKQDQAKLVGKESKFAKLTTSAKTSKSVEVGGGDTIQTLAAKYLGDPDKFKELVLYNNLKPPYVDPTGTIISPYVLVPGDKIAIPQESSPKSPSNVTTGSAAPINKLLSEVQKNFGIDLKLTDDFDLDVNAFGDVNLLASSQNVAQRIVVKLLLELGSLKRHPEIGVGLSIGVKSTVDLSVILDRVRSSLSRDSSIERVIFADVEQQGSSLLINLILKLRNIDQPLTIPVKVA